MPSSYLSGIFGGSPVKPLQHHMEKVQVCVEHLIPLVETVLAGDLDGLEQHYKTIRELERDADALKNEMRRQMPNRLFMPVSRIDMLDVLHLQDEIANIAKDIAGIMLGRKMQIPELIAEDYLEFMKRNVDACSQARTAINELDELIGTGFVKGMVDLVESMLQKLDDIEHETDQMEIKIRGKLLSIEKDLNPVDVMFLYRIIDSTGELADAAEHVGNRLQLTLAR